MHRPTPLEISLSPSRRARAWILALAACTFLMTLTLPVAVWLNAAAALALAVWATLSLRSLDRGRHALRRVRVDGDHRLLLTSALGETQRGRLLPPTYVGARLTTLVWRPDGRRFARADCVLPDMLSPEEFRRLRVLLRYGRSEPTQGAPPSQA